MKWVYILMGITIIGLLVTIGILHFTPTTAPWEPTGHLVVAAYAVPAPGRDAEFTLGIGIDDVQFIAKDGDVVRATLFTRRLTLNDTNDKYFLLETNTAVGEYSRIQFYIRSPELRNAWEQDKPPAHVSLAGEYITIDIPTVVKENETTVVLLGFETIQAIRETSDGNVYLPVIQTETRSGATVIKNTEDTGHVEGGVITGSATYGMDWDGTVRYNFRAPFSVPAPEKEDTYLVPKIQPETTTAPENATNDVSSTTDESVTETS